MHIETIDENHWQDYMGGLTFMNPQPCVQQSFTGVGGEVYSITECTKSSFTARLASARDQKGEINA